MNQLHKVNFEIIRYANCWEDADVLLDGLKIEKGNRCISIGSAGDNSFSLLTKAPEIVVAVDVSKVQLMLIELKKEAIRAFDYETFLQFAGFKPCTAATRFSLFNKIKNTLTTETRTYWEHHQKTIEQGVIYGGKFEHYFHLFSKKVLPLIHNAKKRNYLTATKTPQEQLEFYTKKWDSWRWRLLFKFFFSKTIMGKLGRDPEFFNQVKIPVSEFILNKTAQHLKSEYAIHNHILRFASMGDFGDFLPHYVQPENYEIIQKNLDKLTVHHGLIESAFEQYGKFDAFNLSNIFEYMDAATFRKVGWNILTNATPKARLVYWNLMVVRKLHHAFPDQLMYQKTQTQQLISKDKGFFYKEVVVDKLI